MRRKRSSAVLVALLAVYLSSLSIAAIITVDDNGPADFSTIQAAINMASNGDTIVVEDGIYMGTGNRNIDFQGKTITLKSKNGPTSCTIDCQSETVGFKLILCPAKCA